MKAPPNTQSNIRASISDAEWQVMDAIWSTPSAAAAAEVIASLQARTDWSPRTIKTMLNRLVKKGVLHYQADGRRYLYRAAVTREKCVRVQGRSFLDRVFGGQAGAMLAHFAKHEKLSKKDIEELKSILEQKSSAAHE
ncbi:MAG: BlaI/MecI/CopY family transcriptional regulator [Burkholderiales bacterium]|nr:BlaI/MecI/CopY family transcriptional regulator [Phycisphaerae bacterium]